MQVPPPIDVVAEEISRDDRTTAMLAHILELLAAVVGPFILYMVKKGDSRFAAYHALQATLFGVLFFGPFLLFFGVFFIGFIATASTSPTGDPAGWVVGSFFVVWCSLFAVMIGHFVFTILNALRANSGEWSEYPFAGRWAKRILDIRS
jgi:uncharacterized protein